MNEIDGDPYLTKCIEEIRAMRKVLEESNASSLELACNDARLILAENGLHPDLLGPYRRK